MIFFSLQLLHYVRKVHFRTTAGDDVFFDASGNPPPAYEIMNWKITAEGVAENIVVGTYQPGHTSEPVLTLNTSLIQLGGYNQVNTVIHPSWRFQMHVLLSLKCVEKTCAPQTFVWYKAKINNLPITCHLVDLFQ